MYEFPPRLPEQPMSTAMGTSRWSSAAANSAGPLHGSSVQPPGPHAAGPEKMRGFCAVVLPFQGREPNHAKENITKTSAMTRWPHPLRSGQGINKKKVCKGAAPSRGEKKPTLPFPLFSEPSKAESRLSRLELSQLQSARAQSLSCSGCSKFSSLITCGAVQNLTTQ